MNILIDNRYKKDVCSLKLIEHLARFALEQINAPNNSELSISLVKNEEIQQLNKDYRGKDCPTDVLSFECDFQDKDDSGNTLCLGDIIIAPDVVESMRKLYNTTFEQEISLLIVHGCLHVAGYDHLNDDDAEKMELKEKEILETYGIFGVR